MSRRQAASGKIRGGNWHGPVPLSCAQTIELALAEEAAAAANNRRPRRVGSINKPFRDHFDTEAECRKFAAELKRQFGDRVVVSIRRVADTKQPEQLDLIDWLDRQSP